MKAFERGRADGRVGREAQGRKYQSDAANNAYFEGYAQGIKDTISDKAVVQCNRDFKMFSADLSKEKIVCPRCFRTYIKEDDKFMSDRELKILLK